MAWTENQIDAIESTGGSVLVSAAAGSGKTSVLSERVIRMITREDDPIPADRLLIVTFTKDAAAEMKQRINEKLNALIEINPSQELLRQKQRFYNATVSTIDSFCSSLVREYFHQLGISSDYRVADETELSLLSRRAMDDTFSEFYESRSPEFRDLVRAFLYKNGDSRLRACVSKLSTFLECVPFPEEWLSERAKDYDCSDFTESAWGRTILSSSLDTIGYLIGITEESIALAEADESLSKGFLEPYTAALSCFREAREALKAADWDEAGSHLASAVRLLDGLSLPRTKPKNDLIKRGRAVFAGYREGIKKYSASLSDMFSRSVEEVNSAISSSKPLISELFSVVAVYEKKLRELKNKKNVLYFSDISHLAVSLLAEYSPVGAGYEKTPLSFEIASRYDAVIVDEYQDINEVQDLIFNCVSNGSNLFVVGDVKQSIYTFRQTRPKLFTDRRDLYTRYDRENPVYPATVILDKNFRSRPQICDTVNYIFSRIMMRKTADMDYTEDEYLYVGAEFPESDLCETEIALIDCNEVAKSILGITDPPGKPSKKKYKLDEATGETPLSAEARFIAKRIKELISSGFCVTERNGTSRPAEFRDFAVLMRSPGGSSGKFKQKEGSKKGASELVRLLSLYGIPSYCEQSESFFENREIKLLLNLLRVIDNPINDIPLLSVMMSPLYGFTPDELALLRADSRRCSLYASLKGKEAENPKAASFLKELDGLRRCASSRTVDELLSTIYELTAINEITGALNGGSSASNLRLMRVYAASFESNGYKSLSDFIGYIDRLTARRESLPSAPLLDASAANRVRVLSIHKSKGLEFPVCFLIDAAHGFNDEDFRSHILIDSEIGVGVRFSRELLTVDPASRRAIILKKKHEQIADEMRLLYVAMTRAKEKLIITSTVDYSSHWLDRALIGTEKGEIDPFLISSAGNMLEWILYAAAVNPKTRAAMTGEEPLDADVPGWSFGIIKSIRELSFDMEEHSGEVTAPAEETSVDYAAVLRKNLAFRYRNEALVRLPQKVSASQIAHSRSTEFDTVLAVPGFLRDLDLSATERGTAHHEFLRYCDFLRARSDVRAEIKRLLDENRLSQRQADSIDTDALSDILNHPFFERVINSPAVYREKQFTVEIPPSLIDESYSGAPNSAGCIMQGSVDLAFEEDGKVVIVDYKTDRVKEPQTLIERYSKQLRLYERAMLMTLGKEIGGLYIFSLYLNMPIEVK